MKTASGTSPHENRREVTGSIMARVTQIAIFLVATALILLWGSGHFDWVWAWVYLGISVVVVLINGALMLRASPDMIAERGKPKEMKNWDKVISSLYTLGMYIALPLVAALDLRFGWTRDLNFWWNIVGVALVVAGLEFGSWAMIANAYFSTAVRIQRERGQTVCRAGPYRFVRHPGYVGFITQAFGTALILGSLWALMPSFVSALLLVIRTVYEDRLLRAELPGYADYARETRYRLVPGIW